MLGAPDEGDDDGLGRLGELDELDDELGILGMLLLDEELLEELGILGMPLLDEELDELWQAASAITLIPSNNRDPVIFMAVSNSGLELLVENLLGFSICFNNIVFTPSPLSPVTLLWPDWLKSTELKARNRIRTNYPPPSLPLRQPFLENFPRLSMLEFWHFQAESALNSPLS